MMPASLPRKQTKTSPKYEQTEATYYFIITKSFQVEEIICNFTYKTDDPLTGQQNGRKNIQYHQ